MNKVINININGMIFHIDEEAFVVLDRYLGSLKQHFRNNDGADEILADIESRIAEMLTGMLKDRSEVVSMANVQQVIATMGMPEDMEGAETESKSKSYSWNRDYNFKPGKRMYRDTDNNILGGVCSGISEYMGIDPVWIRLLFVAIFFGFGSGLLIYIILWIILPAAKTPSEKLEMRGERVNISNIEKAVTENLDSIKQRLDKEFSHLKDKNFGHKVESFFEGLFDGVGGALRGVLQVFAWFLSAIFILISACVLIGLLSVIFGVTGLVGFAVPVVFFDFFHSSQQASLVFILLLLVVGLPFLGLMFRSLRYISGYRGKNRLMSSLFSFMWVLAFIGLIVVGFGSATGFRSSYSYSTENILKQPAHDTLYLSASGNSSDIKNFHGHGWMEMGRIWNHIQDSKDTSRIGLVSLNITRSESRNIKLLTLYKSHATSVSGAEARAHAIKYRFIQQDSLLLFDDAFRIPQDQTWSGQNVNLELQIPDGTVIKMRKNMEDIIYNINNVEDMDDDDMPSHFWIMKPDGLTCADCGISQHKNTPKTEKAHHRHGHWEWSWND